MPLLNELNIETFFFSAITSLGFAPSWALLLVLVEFFFFGSIYRQRDWHNGKLRVSGNISS
ncbi:hypothetical protein H6F77_12820 [Microcoleus sp. FACHB-831]|uniref:hypothetical protein n=1 Tax=Microcoleus sp. FACHB-831 TaxID=2692827 RepID=UPI0016875CC8|nr:hypothetical protein [Microcoleus sp. FACHB-831]MBD1921968.1 hypothetical protein [Microcoleus sp. FACHB-831]